MSAWRRAIAGLGVASALVLTGVGAARAEDPAAGKAAVRDVRHWSYDDYTRVVVELSTDVSTEIKQLKTADGQPDRLYFDLPGVWVGTAWPDAIPVADGLLRQVRIGQNTRDRSRVVIDLDGYGRHRLFALSGPDRIVLDVYRDPGETDGVADPMATGRKPAPGHAPPGMRSVRTVMIDPGHGGDDPGATGRGGMLEKHLTLDVALDLRERLRARGFQVHMTRENDRTVSLEERTALAESVRADVFVSLHANAAPGAKTHGLETYYLDQSHERHTIRVAARESGVTPNQLDPLQRAMAGLRIGEVSRYSAKLAEHVHGRIVGGVRDVYGSVRDLGVKQGPFHVLFLSSAPSILVEMGFVTNRREARRLGSKLYRSVVAEEIARGLSGYRSDQLQLVAKSR